MGIDTDRLGSYAGPTAFTFSDDAAARSTDRETTSAGRPVGPAEAPGPLLARAYGRAGAAGARAPPPRAGGPGAPTPAGSTTVGSQLN
ncbi:hypothetical protein OG455_21910 [Kitasatospora sp. NBC_01287]|uniref:hypothetical protein n=1 Tax=Kitasatospora sp. NBC_01287 TaxID=2903573 RepID=UPI00224E2DD6|nr:hypothetical protein [Kitasatospora sp. NBC_01287]MCX4748135.1 hypothetical protein [Kitasatospora sp. NBC_01287]